MGKVQTPGNGLSLVVWQFGEGFAHFFAQFRRVDARNQLVDCTLVVRHCGNPEPRAGSPLDSVPAPRITEQVQRNRPEPRPGRTIGLKPDAVPHLEHACERLLREVEG
jgi:hypothetical protein